MREAVTAYVALGANLGDAVSSVQSAIARIGELHATRVTRQSSLYRTAPLESSGPDYINAVVEIETELDALSLLDSLQAMENEAGRERPYRNAPRTLDLDLLLYGNERIDSPSLKVPHPRMMERAFVLVPLAEIAPQLVSAAALKTISGQRITRI
jgi:2-amino-4-hydroxy-6-hydroxymethyldihydropteridine diphosphokinase